MIKLICALGNPGREYAHTRHNVGWILIDTWKPHLAYQRKFKGEYVRIHAPVNLIILKPLTFMNKSGESLRTCSDFFSIDPEEILVVHDDLELPFGQTGIKHGGGLGGHNGLKSIHQHLGTPDFYRLRLGIGRPQAGSVSSYVLSRFSKDQERELPQMLDAGIRLIEEYLQHQAS